MGHSSGKEKYEWVTLNLKVIALSSVDSTMTWHWVVVIILVDDGGFEGNWFRLRSRSHLMNLLKGCLGGLRVRSLGLVWYWCHTQDSREYVMLPRWYPTSVRM